eukprot:SAG11_NODE_142_length_14906_cov_8.352333_15_plen_126_part_00
MQLILPQVPTLASALCWSDVDHAQRFPPLKFAFAEEYRQPTAMLDSADAEIIALAQRITSTLPEGAPLLERARALRHATRHHITHSTLATGFASASETVVRPVTKLSITHTHTVAPVVRRSAGAT